MARKILSLEEVSTRTRIPIPTLRWYRAKGAGGPKLWKLGGRVVAFEDDVERYIEAQYSATSGDAA